MAAGVTAGTLEEELAPDIKKKKKRQRRRSESNGKSENCRAAEMERRSGGRARNG